MVPVANRPVMEHILRMLPGHGLEQVISNLHWFPETIRNRFGDGSELGIELTYSDEEELLDTAGGVWNVRDFLTEEGSFIVMAGDALTDVDLTALIDAHAAHDGVATMTVKKVANVSEFGVVLTDSEGRVSGFQEKPDPAEALSDLANCMIYAFRPEIFDYFPEDPHVDWAKQIFPLLLEQDVPFHVHETERYWNDVGSLPEYLQGNIDAVTGTVAVDCAGELVDADAGGALGDGVEVSGRVLVGEGAEVGEGARIDGPVVLGPGSRVGAGARVKESVLLARGEVPANGLLAGSIAGRRGALG
jgi:mannose-1-phosphate guanylyltransferase/mannose-1-phosphate guanylyltransferase/phosphomannomutase